MAKQEADMLKKISNSFLKKHGYFSDWGNSGNITWSRNGQETGSISISSFMREDEKYIKLNYTQTDNNTGEKKDFDYKIPLTTTPCNYGGARYWFVCPLSKGSVHCGRRTGVLYKDGDYFGCRHCYDLAYECQHSKYGAIFSYPDRDKLQAEIKRQYYNGKMTRKYKSLVKKINRTDAKMIALAQTFGF